MYAIEYNDDIIILDCGFTFSVPEFPGVDAVIPNINYLIENKEKIRGGVTL